MNKTAKDPIFAWWFAPSDEKLGHQDGRAITLGETHEIGDPLELCANGLHASVSAFDALRYASSSILYRVEIHDAISDTDKICGRRRKYLARINAEPILRRFARECALEVLHLWDAPDVVKKYLETGDENLRAAARDAASAAARATAWDQARDAARDAAWAAARDAARHAASDAAYAAAWAAAWTAASDPERDAARDAARHAAKAAASARLEEMFLAEIIEKEKL
jgi:hypothetical protein